MNNNQLLNNNQLHSVPDLHSSTAKYRQGLTPEPYQHQDFPKIVYKDGNHKPVNSEKEEAEALADGFTLKPEPLKPAEAVTVPAEIVTLPERTVTAAEPTLPQAPVSDATEPAVEVK